MVVLRNEGRWERSNVRYEHNRVLAYEKQSPHSDMEWIDYGLGGLTAAALERVEDGESELAVLYSAPLHVAAGCSATRLPERFFDIGTPAALEETEVFLASSPP